MASVAKLQFLLHIEVWPRHAPGHQVPCVHGVGFDIQGIHQLKANVVSHIVSPPLPNSSGHLTFCPLQSFFTCGMESPHLLHTYTPPLHMKIGGSLPRRPPRLHRKVTETSKCSVSPSSQSNLSQTRPKQALINLELCLLCLWCDLYALIWGSSVSSSVRCPSSFYGLQQPTNIQMILDNHIINTHGSVLKS